MHLLVFTSVVLVSLASALPAGSTVDDPSYVGEMRGPLGIDRHRLALDPRSINTPGGECVNFRSKKTTMAAMDKFSYKFFRYVDEIRSYSKNVYDTHTASRNNKCEGPIGNGDWVVNKTRKAFAEKFPLLLWPTYTLENNKMSMSAQCKRRRVVHGGGP
jgi:hypothetical protein